ncbi:MAG: cold-shock protein [Candidatus Acidiferrales bacterium]
MQGTLSFYDPTKGYGFISTETEDYFFHRSALPEAGRRLRLQHVPCEFDVGEFQGRVCAVAVRLIDAAVSYAD